MTPHVESHVEPPSTPAPAEDGAVVEGSLWKRSRHLHIWRQRHAILHPDGWLHLHRMHKNGGSGSSSSSSNASSSGASNAKASALRASFALSPEWRIMRTPDSHRVLCTFLLTGPGIRVSLGTETEEEAARWVLRIGALCRQEVEHPAASMWYGQAASNAYSSSAFEHGGRLWSDLVVDPAAAPASAPHDGEEEEVDAAAEGASTEFFIETERLLAPHALAELCQFPRLHSAVLGALRMREVKYDPGSIEGSRDAEAEDEEWRLLDCPLDATRVRMSSRTSLTACASSRVRISGDRLRHDTRESDATLTSAAAANCANVDVSLWTRSSGKGAHGNRTIRSRHTCEQEPMQVLADATSLLPTRMAWDAAFEGGQVLEQYGAHTQLVQLVLTSGGQQPFDAVLYRFSAPLVGGGAVLACVSSTYNAGVTPSSHATRINAFEYSLVTSSASNSGNGGDLTVVNQCVSTRHGHSAMMYPILLALPHLHALHLEAAVPGHASAEIVQQDPRPPPPQLRSASLASAQRQSRDLSSDEDAAIVAAAVSGANGTALSGQEMVAGVAETRDGDDGDEFSIRDDDTVLPLDQAAGAPAVEPPDVKRAAAPPPTKGPGKVRWGWRPRFRSRSTKRAVPAGGDEPRAKGFPESYFAPWAPLTMVDAPWRLPSLAASARERGGSGGANALWLPGRRGITHAEASIKVTRATPHAPPSADDEVLHTHMISTLATSITLACRVLPVGIALASLAIAPQETLLVSAVIGSVISIAPFLGGDY